MSTEVITRHIHQIEGNDTVSVGSVSIPANITNSMNDVDMSLMVTSVEKSANRIAVNLRHDSSDSDGQNSNDGVSPSPMVDGDSMVVDSPSVVVGGHNHHVITGSDEGSKSSSVNSVVVGGGATSQVHHHHHYHYFYHHHFHHLLGGQSQSQSPSILYQSPSSSLSSQLSVEANLSESAVDSTSSSSVDSSPSPMAPSQANSFSSPLSISPSTPTNNVNQVGATTVAAAPSSSSILSLNTAALVRTISNGSTFGPISDWPLVHLSNHRHQLSSSKFLSSMITSHLNPRPNIVNDNSSSSQDSSMMMTSKHHHLVTNATTTTFTNQQSIVNQLGSTTGSSQATPTQCRTGTGNVNLLSSASHIYHDHQQQQSQSQPQSYQHPSSSSSNTVIANLDSNNSNNITDNSNNNSHIATSDGNPNANSVDMNDTITQARNSNNSQTAIAHSTPTPIASNITSTTNNNNATTNHNNNNNANQQPQILATTPAQNCLPNFELPLSFGENFILTSQIEASNLYRCIDTKTMQEYCCKIVLSKNYYDFLAGHLRMDGHVGINQVEKIVVGRVHTFVLFSPSYGDLHSYVRTKRRLREPEAMALFQQIVQIVADCHSNGIILRDLKLRKFIFSNKQRTQLKLETLEGASMFDDDDDTLTDKHGCPAYVSPEILYSNSYSGMAADCWSLGVILFTMLVGRYPFHDINPSVVFSKIRRGTFYIPETLSKHAKCLVRSLIRIDPEQRLTTQDALAHRWFKTARSPSASSIIMKRSLQSMHHHHYHHHPASSSSSSPSSSSSSTSSQNPNAPASSQMQTNSASSSSVSSNDSTSANNNIQAAPPANLDNSHSQLSYSSSSSSNNNNSGNGSFQSMSSYLASQHHSSNIQTQSSSSQSHPHHSHHPLPLCCSINQSVVNSMDQIVPDLIID